MYQDFHQDLHHYPSSRQVLVERAHAASPVRDLGNTSVRWLSVARMESLRASGRGFTIWMQLRGQTRIVAREGDFTLQSGEWLALDRDSVPALLAGQYGVTLGIQLPPDAGCHGELLPGYGRMSNRELRIATRLWRNGLQGGRARGGDPARALQSMLAHITALQLDLGSSIARCPGRSIRRKRQVFARMQRARLFLEGHRNRVVRLTELAELTSFSSWYLSKTYHDIYDESPQAASVRLRLERACDLLVGTDRSISEVGAACGFENNCSFARAFRARFHSTASAYRQQYRAGARASQANSAEPAIWPMMIQA